MSRLFVRLQDGYDATPIQESERRNVQKVISVTPEECQKDVIDQIQQLTGKKIFVTEDASLQPHANLKLAGPSDAAHVFRYRSSLKPQLPYLMASQAGLVLRILQAEPENRFDLRSSPKLPREFQNLTSAQLQKNDLALDPDALIQLAGIYQKAIGLQVRSIPISLRVDEHIRQQYPALRDMQRACTIQHLQEGIATLAPNVRKNIPDEIFHPSASMNAALADYWGKVFGDDSLVVGYQATGFLDVGVQLLQQFDEIPSDANNDRQLVQSWIEILGLQKWFFTTPKQQA